MALETCVNCIHCCLFCTSHIWERASGRNSMASTPGDPGVQPMNRNTLEGGERFSYLLSLGPHLASVMTSKRWTGSLGKEVWFWGVVVSRWHLRWGVTANAQVEVVTNHLFPCGSHGSIIRQGFSESIFLQVTSIFFYYSYKLSHNNFILSFPAKSSLFLSWEETQRELFVTSSLAGTQVSNEWRMVRWIDEWTERWLDKQEEISSHKSISWFLNRNFAGQKGLARNIQSDEKQGLTAKITLSSKAII